MKKRRNKVFEIIILLCFISLIFNSCCYAYSTNKYSINVPDNYSISDADSFTDSDGNNINITITTTNNASNFKYTKANLEKLVDMYYTQFDELKMSLKEQLHQKYGYKLSNTQIEEYLSSFKINSVITKEITTFTKNNYKCFHIMLEYSILGEKMYGEQYATASASEIYVLTISHRNINVITNNSTKKEMVDSFTINNYKDVESDSNTVLEKILMAAVSVVIIVILYNIIYNRNNNKNNNQK